MHSITSITDIRSRIKKKKKTIERVFWNTIMPGSMSEYFKYV